jgi:hypothetical protein
MKQAHAPSGNLRDSEAMLLFIQRPAFGWSRQLLTQGLKSVIAPISGWQRSIVGSVIPDVLRQERCPKWTDELLSV